MNVLEIYQPPFRADGGFIWAANGVMALMSTNPTRFPEQMMERTADILNEKSYPIGGPEVGFDNGEIYINGDPFLIVRGWSYLTGSSCLNLSTDEASEIQDRFAEWVSDKIRGKKFIKSSK